MYNSCTITSALPEHVAVAASLPAELQGVLPRLSRRPRHRLRQLVRCPAGPARRAAPSEGLAPALSPVRANARRLQGQVRPMVSLHGQRLLELREFQPRPVVELRAQPKYGVSKAPRPVANASVPTTTDALPGLLDPDVARVRVGEEHATAAARLVLAPSEVDQVARA